MPKVGISRFLGFVTIFLILAGIATAQRPIQDPQTPVLVELFTSEGCSDCPPADALLARLQSQPIPGAEIITLSEHVDYWNQLGWRDPFSSPLFTQRQSEYAHQFGINSVYTPQMVVDGSAEFVGSDAQRAQSAIGAALSAQKMSLRVGAVHRQQNKILFSVELGSKAAAGAKLVAVLAQKQATSVVDEGENGGRTLTHVSVAKSIEERVLSAQASQYEFAVPIEKKLSLDGFRLVVFLQNENGKVLGAAAFDLAAVKS